MAEKKNGTYKAIAIGDDDNTSLSRGQYIIRGLIATESPRELFTEHEQVLLGLPGSNEKKRVYFHKVDAGEPNEKGEQRFTAVITIVDNPIWLPAIIAGVGAIVGGAVIMGTTDTIEVYSEQIENTAKWVGVGLIAIAFIANAIK